MVFVAVVLITQMIIPGFKSQPLFPYFRKGNSELLNIQHELSDINISEKVHDVKEVIKDKTKSLRRR